MPALATLALLLLPMPAAGAPYTAPGNKVLWGGQGGYSAGHIRDFARQSGKHPAVFNYLARSAMHQMYNFPLWRGKPFAFAEWGVWGADVPGFVGPFFGFLRSHPRVRMAVYYQSSFLKPEFRLSSHSRSRAALRKAVKWRRLTGVAP